MTTTSSTTTATRPAERAPWVVHPLAATFLLVDAAVTGVNGLAYVAAGGWLADWFGMPVDLVRVLGVVLLAVSAGVVLLATRSRIPRRGVWVLVAVNTAWVVASVDHAVLADLTGLGTAWVLLQAGVVAVFAAVQAWLARRG
ncbi:hypothetical protein SFC79_17785 [Nocardioides sp. S-58]|uniref:Uncharacterized protein n=1 Tax=Nocardioides renjunii TaxID=3095075 RepID=A0ABU5KF89_9ACTN|nr:hypothetical protein [Nocardioides sp. S-58]MDZ5663631.1 hypothetical protein [Nocardioides sp. S-58]